MPEEQKQDRAIAQYLKLLFRSLKTSPTITGMRTAYERVTQSPNINIINAQRTKTAPSLEEAISAFSMRWPEVESHFTSNPVFIFSAGWRAGSTLLQRLVSSSEKIVIWGEPYGHSGLIEHLSSPMRVFTYRYPRSDSFIGEAGGNKLANLAETWIANLNPDAKYFLEAQATYLINLFEKPAQSYGALRWGIKEVRLTIDHAIYLNWLFPNSKFLFLYRNPYRAYSSYREFGKFNVWPYDYWYNTWPDDPIDTPSRFGQHWKTLLEGYLSGYQKVSSMVVKYEDLSRGELDFKALEEFLEIKLDKSILQNRVKGAPKRKSDASSIQLEELKSAVEPLASQLGYEYPTA
ncbi:MAG: sulfotransferase [Cyanophyceae cyanobacterium]